MKLKIFYIKRKWILGEAKGAGYIQALLPTKQSYSVLEQKESLTLRW